MLDVFRKAVGWARLTDKRCPVCSTLTDGSELCHTCAERLAPRTGGYCPQCGDIFGDDDTPATLCPQCRTSPPPWERLHFHSLHAGTLRDLILSYKFNSGIGRTRLLSAMACAAFDEEQPLPDIIVPVPLHTRRLLWRGFNQSVGLALALGKYLDRPVQKNGLVRTRHTVPQTSLGMQERQANIKDAFAADAEKIRGKTVLVVDDVYTTGATLKECAKTLKQAGATGVDVLVLAKAIS